MNILSFMFILRNASSSHECLYLTSTILSRDTVEVTGHQRSEALFLPRRDSSKASIDCTLLHKPPLDWDKNQ